MAISNSVFISAVTSDAGGITGMMFTAPAGGVPLGATIFVGWTAAFPSDGSATVTDDRGNTYVGQGAPHSISVQGSDYRLFRSFVTTALIPGDEITVTFIVEDASQAAGVAWYHTGMPDADPYDSAQTIEPTFPSVDVQAVGDLVVGVIRIKSGQALNLNEDPTFTPVRPGLTPSAFSGTNNAFNGAARIATSAGAESYEPDGSSVGGSETYTLLAYSEAVEPPEPGGLLLLLHARGDN